MTRSQGASANPLAVPSKGRTMLLLIICAAIAFVLLALLGLVHVTRTSSEELTGRLRRSRAATRIERQGMRRS